MEARTHGRRRPKAKRGPELAELRLEDIIRRPLITEKNTMLMEIGQYTFEVDPRSEQDSDRRRVEEAFNVR